MSQNLDLMYRDVILDHYRSPRGRKPIDRTDFASEGHNPACGDDITLQVAVDNGTVKSIYANCRGCAISTASGSIMAEILKDKTIDEAKILAANVKKMLKGEEFELPDNVGDIDALEGVKKFPVRIKCALLAWMTLLEGIKNYETAHAKVGAVISTESGDE
jgi:nitrogen fixation NifU-like protein